MKRILVIDDEEWLREMVQLALSQKGYDVIEAKNGAVGIEVAQKQLPDLILCDVNMEKMDGYGTLSSLRNQPGTAAIPFILMTGLADNAGMRHGMELGADDYLPKPFELAILLARLQGLLRRSEWLHQSRNAGAEVRGKPQSEADPASISDYGVFSFGGKTINFGTLQLHTNGNTIQLTMMESELLRHLMRNQGRVVSRKSILEEVWGLHEDTDTRAIDNFIVRLRRYIEENPSKPRHLLTVRGVGYRFVAEPEHKG